MSRRIINFIIDVSKYFHICFFVSAFFNLLLLIYYSNLFVYDYINLFLNIYIICRPPLLVADSKDW